jgi:exodeoxyribonuclease VII large subunit
MNPSDRLENTNNKPPVLTVSALNQAVARMLERNFPLTWVSGEISNLTRAVSGHWYFTLKDDAAQVRAVMFRGRAQYADFTPKEGDKVEVRALVTLYAPRGDYQLNVESIRKAGVGNLYEAFLQLKGKLEAEGLFDNLRKRSLPLFARTIGIVTSLQAAALHDILSTLARRAPHINVILYPTPVQGDGAGVKIAQAIKTAAQRAECDILLVCRGGGSIEDLWSFNEEVVARAIVATPMPVIAGVGHETDFTIADFAADLRAPTPTAAAELAATPRADWLTTFKMHAQDLNRAMQRQLSNTAQKLDWLSRSLVSPGTNITRERLKLHSVSTLMRHAAGIPLSASQFALVHLQSRLAANRPDTEPQRSRLCDTKRRLAMSMSVHAAQRRQTMNALRLQLELLNPQRTLERGYAIITDTRGRIAHSPEDLRPREIFTVKLANGSAQIGIASVQTVLE